MFERMTSSKQEMAAAQNIKERDYWLDKLSGDLVKSGFPTDIKDPTMTGEGSATAAFTWTGELYDKLIRLCSGYDQVLHMALAAGTIALLSRYTGNMDIVIGVPIYRQEVEGEFVNTVLALRTRLDEKMSFKELLIQVRQAMIEAAENQNYPIESLLYKLKIPESADGFPLFDTAVLLENVHDIKYIRHLRVNTIFSFHRQEGRLGGVIQYNRKLFRKARIERLADHLGRLLATSLQQVDSRLCDIEILSPGEREQLLHDFNDTAAPYGMGKTLPGLFEDQTSRAAGFTAVVFGEEQVTYLELNERANQLARTLRDLGTQGEELAAVIMNRSIEMVTAVMGILKARGAYVPLEPDLPESRVCRILSCLGARQVLTDDIHLAKIGHLAGGLSHLEHVVFLNHCHHAEKEIRAQLPGQEIVLPAAIRGQAVDNLTIAASAGDVAYVIYTSGSTGVPKGVMERHRPVVNVIEWVNRTFRVGAGDKLQFVASLGFDLSVYDIFGILAVGASIYVVDNRQVREPQCLLDMIFREGTTSWDSAPATLQQLAPFFQEARENRQRGCFRLVFLSGDWIPLALPDVLRETFPGVQVVSLGGATEATIWSNFYPVDTVSPFWKSIPYGKPIQNARYYILDSYLAPCPAGVPGDLYIGGQCLASGYINDVALTAGKFIPDPFSRGEVIYRTGDLARWFEDGNIEFLGRKDFQVKIRGHRIELGEIEAQLLNHRDIETVILMVREDPRGEKFICAYIAAGKEIETSQLRSFLLAELPEYMVPAYFIQLDKIPLTPSGKVDRKALLEQEVIPEERLTAPRNDIDRGLALLWAGVLGVDAAKIGIDSNFFDLGGHSLNASELVSSMHQRFDVRVPLAEIFRMPTIRELSDYVKSSIKEVFQGIESAEKMEYYPLSAAQRGIYLTQQLDSSSTAYNMPFVMKLDGVVDRERLEETFKILIRRHNSLRTRFRLRDHEPVQQELPAVEFDMQYYETKGEEIGSLIDGFIRPFDLKSAPLLRAGLVMVEENSFMLMFDVHHIVADGTSIQILRNEFIKVYAGEPLPPMRIQYNDYSHWQGRQKGRETMTRQRDYWLEVFREKSPILNIPVDFPRPSVQSYEGRVFIFDISREDTAALNRLAGERNATLFIVMLAVYNVLLLKLTGEEDIVVGTGTAGRRHADVANIIGLFMNTLALRNRVDPDLMFSKFLDQVKRRTLDAFENQDYAFDQLLQDLKKQGLLIRDSSRNPLFDTMFSLENYEIHSRENEVIKLPGLKVSPYEFEYKTSKFDWFFIAYEIDDMVRVFWEYSTVLFKRSTIEQFKDHYLEIVKQVVENKNILVKDIKISDKRLDVKSDFGKEDFEDFGF